MFILAEFFSVSFLQLILLMKVIRRRLRHPDDCAHATDDCVPTRPAPRRERRSAGAESLVRFAREQHQKVGPWGVRQLKQLKVVSGLGMDGK